MALYRRKPATLHSSQQSKVPPIVIILILIVTSSFCSLFFTAGCNRPSVYSVLPSICNAELLQGCAALQEAEYVEDALAFMFPSPDVYLSKIIK